MKTGIILMLSLFSITTNAFTIKNYEGEDNGTRCYLSILTDMTSPGADSLRLNKCSTFLPVGYKLKIIDNKMSVDRNYATLDEDKDCSIVVKFNDKSEPVSAVMKAGHAFSPILLTKNRCKNFVQVQ